MSAAHQTAGWRNRYIGLLHSKRTFITFAVIGVINTLVDVVSFVLLTQTGMPIVPANILSTSAALGTSYVLNKRFTFASSGSTNRAIVPFLAVTLGGIWVMQPIVIYLGLGGLNLLGIFQGNATLQTTVAKVGASVASMVWNYVLYKRFVFKPTKPAA